MVTWLTRSLLFIVAGAVLAYAVTLHNDTIDIQTTGLILLLVGAFDLLLNLALHLYYMGTPLGSADPYPGPARSYERSAERPAPDTAGRRAPLPRPYPPGDGYPPDDGYATRPIPRDNPDWH